MTAIDNSIQKTEGAIISPGMSPEMLEAQRAFISKKIPEHAVRRRAARGKKSLDYVDHVYATEAIQNGLPLTWSFDLVSYEIFDEGEKGGRKQADSVLAVTRFTFVLVMIDGNENYVFLPRTVTETGVFLNDLKLPKAAAVAAAVSRGLVRCLMRMFGFGIQFYKNDEDITPDQAWTSIKDFGEDNGISQERIGEIMQGIGINKDNIVNRFTDLFDAVGAEIKSEKVTPMPNFSAPSTKSEEAVGSKSIFVPEQATTTPQEDAINEESMQYASWEDIDKWLKANGIIPSDATEKVRNYCIRTGVQYSEKLVPEYWKHLRAEYDHLFK